MSELFEFSLLEFKWCHFHNGWIKNLANSGQIWSPEENHKFNQDSSYRCQCTIQNWKVFSLLFQLHWCQARRYSRPTSFSVLHHCHPQDLARYITGQCMPFQIHVCMDRIHVEIDCLFLCVYFPWWANRPFSFGLNWCCPPIYIQNMFLSCKEPPWGR